jgi:hypothetical protein
LLRIALDWRRLAENNERVAQQAEDMRASHDNKKK